jgi:hypothetical protein
MEGVQLLDLCDNDIFTVNDIEEINLDNISQIYLQEALYLCCLSHKWDVSNYLIGNNIDIHYSDENILKKVSLYGDYDGIKFLSDHNVEVSYNNFECFSILFKYHHIDTIKLLLHDLTINQLDELRESDNRLNEYIQTETNSR